jgi:hypothetical protein
MSEEMIAKTFDMREFATLQALMNEVIAKQNNVLYQEIKAISDKQDKQGIYLKTIDHKIDAFDENLPLFAVECDRITTTVKAKGVTCLGGKKAAAYRDPSLRGRVYTDIYHQLKREFSVGSFKAIKRNQIETAVNVIEAYQLPHSLEEEIKESNQAS